MPDTITPTPEVDTTRDALFRALRLKATDAPSTQANNAPISDSGNGIEVPTTGVNRTTLGEMVAELSKAEPTVTPPVVTPPVATTQNVVPPVVVTPVVPPVVTPPVDDKLKEELRKKLEMPNVPPATPATPVNEPMPLSLDLSGLDPDEVDVVQLAHFAEIQNPTRYSGHARRTLDHIKQVKAYRTQKQSEDPSIEFNDDNDEYQNLVRRAPGYERGDRERMERKRLSEEIRRETLKEVSVSQQKLEQELRGLKAAPVVDKTVAAFDEFLSTELPLKSEDVLESETAQNIRSIASAAAREFMLLSTQLKSYDPKNEAHTWLAKFIQEQGEVLQKSDAPQKTRGSKTFVTRASYHSMPEAKKAEHFTFSDQEVLELLAINAKLAAEQIVKTEREKLEKYGYKHTKAAATPPPATTPPVVTQTTTPNGGIHDVSPRGGVAPSDGGLTPVAPNGAADPFLRHLMSKMPATR